MKIKSISVLSVMVVLNLAFSPFLFADAGGADDVKAEIEALKARISQLETKLASMPANPPAAAATPATPTLEIPSLVKGIQLSGFVDTTYNYNFNAPNSQTNLARVFDNNANTFNMDAVKITLQKSPTADSRVGFRTDILAGHDAELIHSAGLGNAGEPFDLEQGYVEMLLPTTNVIPGANDLDVKAGKFVTLHGAEVIEGKDNWNISRSLLFGFAIPFTHTGVMANYPFAIAGISMHVCAGIVNGWDSVTDSNNGKSLHWQYGLDGLALPGDSKLTASLSGTTGAEQAGDGSKRNLTDVVITYNTPWKPLTLMYNFDYANESDLVSQTASGLDGNSANWFGHAGYARIDINDQWSISGRGEYFNDEDGFRVVSGTPNDYWEWTGTLEYRPWKNLITRLEYRYDGADHSVFPDKSLPAQVLKDNQSTIAAEAIYVF